MGGGGGGGGGLAWEHSRAEMWRFTHCWVKNLHLQLFLCMQTYCCRDVCSFSVIFFIWVK